MLLASVNAHSQPSTSGKDFWFTFGGVLSTSSNFYQIRIVTTQHTQATITFIGTGDVIPLSLPAGTVYTYHLTDEQKSSVFHRYSSSVITSGSVHIEADRNISVYAVNMPSYASDVTGILPTAALGLSYYNLSYSPMDNFFDSYVTVSTEDNTTVYEDGIAVAVLDKGEVYFNSFPDDVSGKHITADNPVAHFVTTTQVRVPNGAFRPGHFYQQLYAEPLFGNRFFVPVTIRGIERVRIVASQDNTVISLTGGTPVSGSLTLDAGEWTEIEIYASENGCYIEAGKPVGVASYMTVHDYPGLSYNFGGPSMVWIPPVEQTFCETLLAPFWEYDAWEFIDPREDHVLIVVPASAKNLTEMKKGDGDYTALTGGEWRDHPSGYSYYTLQLEKLNISHSFKNPEGLITLAYGLRLWEAYYYVVSGTNRYFDVNGTYYQSFENEILCDGEIRVEAAVKYPADAASGYLRWQVDDVEQTAFTDSLRWEKRLPVGRHSVRMIFKDELGEPDTLTTSFIVEEKKETIINKTICRNNPYLFKGEYLSATGAYRDSLSTVFGCDSIIVLNLTAHPADTARLSGTIYAGEGYYENGFDIPPQYPGTRSDTLFLQNRFDCDSMVVLNTEIICRKNETPLHASICQNEPYFFKGGYLNMPGVYRDTLPAAYSCDSIIILDLTVYPADTVRLSGTVYAGEGYYENGFDIPPQYPGTRSDTLFFKNRFDCDSMVVLDLRTVCPSPVETVLSGSVCRGESYSGYGFTPPPQDVPGNYAYRQELTGAYGCDSIVTLHLTVNPPHETVFSARTPVNRAYSANGFSVPPQPQSGFFDFEETFSNHFGCDSVVTLHLTVYAGVIPDSYFSPNGDGVNDVWNIRNIEYFEFFTVEIYDRYGKSLVRYVNHFTPWDGVCQGQKMPATDYWYVITLEDMEGAFVGHFTLVR
jgi:gliding motility-associated-like protein